MKSRQVPLNMLFLFVFICIINTVLVQCKDLYAVLGIKKGSTAAQIRKAYRQKAKDTHPDKQPNIDPEVAATQFRAVVEAYETLSDDDSRKHYDRTGQSADDKAQQRGSGGGWQQEQQQRRNQRNKYDGGGFWNFGFGSQSSQGKQKGHRYLYDFFLRDQIRAAQARLINIKSYKQLRSICTPIDEENGDESAAGHFDFDFDLEDDTTSATATSSSSKAKKSLNSFSERYTLLAFYDSSVAGCEESLLDDILFPWPFAGQSGGSGVESMWWDEIMIVGKIDLAGSKDNEKLMAFGRMFGAIEQWYDRMGTECPVFAFIPRGTSFSETSPDMTQVQNRHFREMDHFQKWVWDSLTMTMTVVNKTPWTLHQWWIHGTRGNRKEDILPGATASISTYISHTFFFRAQQVTGNTLTNESGLFWYTARIQDDGKTFDINTRCFDLSGECKRWEREGFCDRTKKTPWTRQNPGHHDYVLSICPVSCKFDCGASVLESTNTPPTKEEEEEVEKRYGKDKTTGNKEQEQRRKRRNPSDMPDL